MTILDKKYWTDRYANNTTGWDVGYPTPPITNYFDQYTNKDAKVLTPGAGNGQEAAYLWETGFKNVNVLDISHLPIANFKAKHPGFPKKQVHLGDFFAVTESYDIIVEQTFFCALEPQLRPDYVRQCHNILLEGGFIVGVMFGKVFDKSGPPFGGTSDEYRSLFEPYFDIQIMEPCTNSIPPRLGAELFVKMIKK